MLFIPRSHTRYQPSVIINIPQLSRYSVHLYIHTRFLGDVVERRAGVKRREKWAVNMYVLYVLYLYTCYVYVYMYVYICNCKDMERIDVTLQVMP